MKKLFILLLLLICSNIAAQNKSLPNDFTIRWDVDALISEIEMYAAGAQEVDFITYLDSRVDFGFLEKNGAIYSGVLPVFERYEKNRSFFTRPDLTMGRTYRLSNSFVFHKINSKETESIEPEYVEAITIVVNSQNGSVTVGDVMKRENPSNAFLRAWYGSRNKPTQTEMKNRLKEAKQIEKIFNKHK